MLSFTLATNVCFEVVGREGKEVKVKVFQAIMLHEREIGRKKRFLMKLPHN